MNSFPFSEKANNILDASEELFIKYGYDKTTMDDIAKSASISKGAIYLQFESKTELFEKLLFRESARYYEMWFQLIEQDPKGGLLSGMYRNMLKALTCSRVMMAAFSQDENMLGSYMKKPGSSIRFDSSETMRPDFIMMMQKANAIREDVDPKIVAHIIDMIAFSLVSMGRYKDKSGIPPMEELIDFIADMMDRTLTPEDGGDSEGGKKALNEFKMQMIKKQDEGTNNDD